MKIPVEYLQVLLVAPEAPSALRIWLELFKGEEPTHFATDEDGDTSARGPRNGYWIDLHRVNDSINLFATPVERKASHDRSEPFRDDVWPGVLSEVLKRAHMIAATVEVERLGVTLVCGRHYPSIQEAITSYRSMGEAFTLLPAKAMEARYDFAVAQPSTSLEGYSIRRGVQYRAGRRAVADAEGSYEASDGTIVSWQPHLANVITVGTRTKPDMFLGFDQIPGAYAELQSLATLIWETGVDAFA